MISKYTVNIRWSDEDDGFIATCNEFPGVSAFGETYEEAAKEIDCALQATIESCISLGRELPCLIDNSPTSKESVSLKTA